MQKRERHISFIVVPHHKAGQYAVDLSYRALRWLAVLAGVILLFIVVLVVNYGQIYWRAGQYELMRKRQDEMEREFSRLGALKAEIARLQGVEGRVRGMLQTGRQPDTLNVTQISTAPAPAHPSLPSAAAPAPPDTAPAQPPSLKPAQGWVSAGLGPEHPGVDIAAREGEPVLAAADGSVAFAGQDDYFGNKIVISHGKKYETMYGHNGKVMVRAGERVRRGQIIALVGSTGVSSGPHLHYELRVDGKPADPTRYWINR